MSKRRTFWPLLVSALLVVGALALPPAANADQLTLTLTAPNVGGLDCCTGPYASVLIDRTSNTMATVTFTSLTNGGYIYLLAGAQAADLNVNATGFTVGTITGSNAMALFTPGPYTTGSGNVDGFGGFNLTIDSFDGFHHSATGIEFTLTDTSGTWASAGDVLAANGNGSTAAVHGFACAEPGCSYRSGVAYTGYASNGTEVEVPEPASLTLLGAGLLGLAGWLRRRK